MRRLRSKDRYKGWPLFYFLCQVHLKGVYDKKRDLKGAMYNEDKGVSCDYVGCRSKATNEYFPNLIKLRKEAKKKGHYRMRMLHELKDFTASETGTSATSGCVIKWSTQSKPDKWGIR